MCNFMEEYRDYYITIGKEQGLELGMLNAVKLLVEQGKSIIEIAT